MNVALFICILNVSDRVYGKAAIIRIYYYYILLYHVLSIVMSTMFVNFYKANNDRH